MKFKLSVDDLLYSCYSFEIFLLNGLLTRIKLTCFFDFAKQSFISKFRKDKY